MAKVPKYIGGEYKRNPAETTRDCRYCGHTFHHMGISPHQRACALRTPAGRREFFERVGRYHWFKDKDAVVTKLPVSIQQIESAAPSRALKRGLPAPQETFVRDGQRIGFTVTIDPEELKAAFLKAVKINSLKT